MTARLLAVTFVATRSEAHRVAVHVLARERLQREGRIGLQVTAGGFGTDRLRVDGTELVGPDGRVPIRSLRELATFAGVDLDAPLSVGHDTPPLGKDAVRVDPEQMERLAVWFAFSWSVLDELCGGRPITLWPEHFDAAFVVDERVNVGASPGDGFRDEPYLYVGPWGSERPGPADYWNAPFGAVAHTLDRDEALRFYRRGLGLLEVGVE
jgi:hypothetical protein